MNTDFSLPPDDDTKTSGTRKRSNFLSRTSKTLGDFFIKN